MKHTQTADERAYELIPRFIKGFQARGQFNTLRDDAEELAANCFMELRERNAFTKFNEGTPVKFEAYLKPIVRNWLVDQTRAPKKSLINHDSFDALNDPDDDERSLYNFIPSDDDVYTKVLVSQLINQLSDAPMVSRTGKHRSYRQALIMTYEGYSKKEMADEWGISEAAVASMWENIQETLRA